jgi:hypothetical protein
MDQYALALKLTFPLLAAHRQRFVSSRTTTHVGEERRA